MRILISAHVFAPGIGGIEQVTGLLAREFTRLGHEVRIVTQQPGAPGSEMPYPVLRRPSDWTLLRSVRWCDVYWQSNISLRTLWPALLIRRPVVVTHHTWIRHLDKNVSFGGRLKLRATRHVCNLGVSEAVSASIPAPCETVPNPYDDSTFFNTSSGRARQLVFVGRLVSDKGAALVVTALSHLKQQSREVNLTIIGSGPEEPSIREQIARLRLGSQVVFAGPQTGAQLATTLNSHEILVVPSVWNEPFGLVALEGIACGCFVIGSAGGGLKEAIGPCGVTFPNGDAHALAARIRDFLDEPETRDHYLASAANHLRTYQARNVARHYLAIFERLAPH